MWFPHRAHSPYNPTGQHTALLRLCSLALTLRFDKIASLSLDSEGLTRTAAGGATSVSSSEGGVSASAKQRWQSAACGKRISGRGQARANDGGPAAPAFPRTMTRWVNELDGRYSLPPPPSSSLSRVEAERRRGFTPYVDGGTTVVIVGVSMVSKGANQGEQGDAAVARRR